MNASLLTLSVLCFSYAFGKVENEETSEKKAQLAVISFDGFRWDYVEKYQTPNLWKMAKSGVHARTGYFSTFITKTFPTHFSIATGLFEESHGLIDNEFYDMRMEEEFARASTDPKWYNGEPIWNTAMKQGKRAHTFYWPGSNVRIQGMKPDICFDHYDQSTPLRNRTQALFNWVRDGVDLSMVYFHKPDDAGHKFGTFAEETKVQVEEVDREIGYLLRQLKRIKNGRNLNLIILSDHGMVDRAADPYVWLEDYVDMSEVERVGQYGIIVGIIPKEGKLEKVYQDLKKAPHSTVYYKEELPQRFHYNHADRTLPIVAIADEGYLININNRTTRTIGFHGYDNLKASMKPIFFATGPAFKTNVEHHSFYGVDLYNLFCKILGLKPASTNGTMANIEPLLK